MPVKPIASSQFSRRHLGGGPAAPEQVLSESIETFKDLDDLSFQFIATMAVRPAPALFSFNMGGERKLLEHSGDGVVQAGSPTEFQTELFRTVLRLLDERLPPRPEVFLVAAVAWLQSIGTREYVLERGIGGAFYGLYSDTQGIKWQSDVVFGIHRRMSSTTLPVITMVRDNVVLVHSGVDEASRAMYSSTSSTVTIAEWYARWGSFDDAALGSAIRFVVLIDCVDWRVAVFELAEDGSSRYLRFEGPTRRSDGRLQIAVDFAPEVIAILGRPIRPPRSPSGVPIFFAWSPADGDPKIVQFVMEPRS